MNVTIEFSAGRRGAGSIDCLVCGVPIHQRVDPDDPAPYDPTLAWYDGHGDSAGVDFTAPERRAHHHSPAKEIGPTFTYEYAQLTYDTLRVDGGETLAVWDTRRGDWVLTDLAGEFAGEAYSDATIAAVSP